MMPIVGLLNPIETPSGDEMEPDDSWGPSPISLAKATETKNLDMFSVFSVTQVQCLWTGRCRFPWLDMWSKHWGFTLPCLTRKDASA